jgi:autotransporter strand-loop-strand O-heptosyltransferase
MNILYHADLFIGLSSGLSWLNWALNKKTVMISNFTNEDHEFSSNTIRILNKNVCNGCWNSSDIRFDAGDWNWCPKLKNTDRQFECHKSIKIKDVINQIEDLI